jgi:hypothetical protein
VFLTIGFGLLPVHGLVAVFVVRIAQTVIARMQIRRLLVILAGLAVHIEKDFFSTIIHTVILLIFTSRTMASGHSSFSRLIAFSTEVS